MADSDLGNPRQIESISDSLDNLEVISAAIRAAVEGTLTTSASVNSTIGDGRKTITAAGTREQLSSSSIPVKKVVIQALQTNTGMISVGGSTVVAASGVERGYIIAPFNSITITVTNLNLIYLDSTVSGEGVSYTYEV